MRKDAITFLTVFVILAMPIHTPAMQVIEYGTISDEGAIRIQNAYDDSGIPSVQGAIIINDTLKWAGGYGNQNTLDTVFRAASLTKTLTAAAFLKLNESGIIDLDDDVSDYLPFQVRHPDHPDSIITIRMVLEHKAGMAGVYQFGQPWSDPVISQILADNGITGDLPEVPGWNGIRLPLRDIINSTNINDPEAWKPTFGTTGYSNTGYFFLSFLLEYITNDTWSKYIHDNILSPLGMDDTVFNITETSNPVAFPHILLNNGTLLQLPIYRDYGYGAGGLITTVSDLAKFYIAVMNGGKYGEVQLFEPEYVPFMKEYLQPAGSMIGYGGMANIFVAEDRDIGLILFYNWPGGGVGPIWSAMLWEANGPYTTTTTIPPPIDLTLLGSATAVIIAVFIVMVVIVKRKK
ncbi:MAG: serine hydrolase domain-containing protein [Candidatus Thorarchaeota archaeon]